MTIMGIFFIVGICVAIICANLFIKHLEGSPKIFWNAVLVALPCMFLFSRWFDFLPNYKNYIENPIDIIHPLKGELVAYGGLFGSVVGFLLYLYIKKIPNKLHYFNFLMPFFALAGSITRIGCFFNGCDYGKPTNLPWAITYKRGAPVYYSHLAENLIPKSASHSLSIHPVQLYESLFLLLGFLAGLYLLKKNKNTGIILISAYAIFRFLIEFLRGDKSRGFFLLFSTSQWISIIILLLIVPLLYFFYKEAQNKLR